MVSTRSDKNPRPSHLKNLAIGAMALAKGNPVALTTIFGGAIYVLAFESYRSILRPFGVTPADVGIGYTEVIWPVVQSVGFLAACLAGGSVLLSRFDRFRAVLRRSGVAILLPVAVLLTALVSSLAIAEMVQYRDSILAGKAYSPFFSSRLQVLAALRANSVRVTWNDLTKTQPMLPASELLFLGSADGIAVLYSHGSREILRVPVRELVMVSTIPAESRDVEQQSK